ncbi:hypothetical protein [Congregibacter sp.]|jgi:hypothetical protein|uniref:hypothetical protein n=1 Tax=Congregibacter sp. TaxID=2744308 RepID=UPI0039E6C55C
MMSHRPRIPSLLILSISLLAPFSLAAPGPQTDADAFTRYELLAPETHSFRIYYDVSAATEGATRYYNPIRRGSDPDVHGVHDRMTGKPLEWALVEGGDAKASGLLPNAEPDSQYIRVDLARPVPANGRGRVLIDKTYMDAASYFAQDEVITFSRVLGIKRNSVVLPSGYELLSVSYPSQVITQADGRIAVSFVNPGASGVPYEVTARPLKLTTAKTSSVAQDFTSPPAATLARPMVRVDLEIDPRAPQSRDIVYFLQQPETHAFRLYHDYEEARAGTDRYLNIVRAGSKASNPSAEILDTGEQLEVETLLGTEISDRDIDIGEPITDRTEVVAIWFDPVPAGGSRLLRISETYTDPNRYLSFGDEFVWDRSFGRSRNTVVLPEGWYLTANAVPATVNTRDDGRIELIYSNDRPGNIDVFIKGRRR